MKLLFAILLAVATTSVGHACNQFGPVNINKGKAKDDLKAFYPKIAISAEGSVWVNGNTEDLSAGQPLAAAYGEMMQKKLAEKHPGATVICNTESFYYANFELVCHWD
jgi:hypothetical protein